MRIKLDENIPLRFSDILFNLGHQVDTVPQEGLTERDDPEVWSEDVESWKRCFVFATKHKIRVRRPA